VEISAETVLVEVQEVQEVQVVALLLRNWPVARVAAPRLQEQEEEAAAAALVVVEAPAQVQEAL